MTSRCVAVTSTRAGHVRTLAGLVGIDPAPLLAEYDATIASNDDGPVASQIYETEATGRAITRTAEKRGPKWGIAAIGAALVGIIIFAALGLSNGPKKNNTATPPPVVAATTIAAGVRGYAKPIGVGDYARTDTFSDRTRADADHRAC